MIYLFLVISVASVIKDFFAVYIFEEKWSEYLN